MNLDKGQLSGVTANILLAAGAVLLKPALDSLLIFGFPDDTLGEPIGELIYSKRLALLESTAKGHDILTPFARTTKPIPSSMPLLQPSSTTAGIMFGLAACFLSLMAAGTFLVWTAAGSQSYSSSPPPPSRSLSETLAYNREQRQARDKRAIPRRRGGRGREFSCVISPFNIG